MHRALEICVAALLAFGLAAPAVAAEQGERLTGSLRLGAVQVPLPAGTWVVAGTGTQPFEMPSLGAYGTIQNAVLLQVVGTRVVAVLEANANAIPVSDGWGRTRACNEGTQFQVITRYKSGWETGCQFVATTVLGNGIGGPRAWDQARHFAEEHGLALPTLALTAGFRSSDRSDIVDARYHFSPTLLLGAGYADDGSADAWSVEALKADPLKAEAVAMVKDWASGYDGWIDRGLHNQLDGGAAGMLPQVAAYAGAAPQLDGKLAALDQMYRGGRLSWSDYLAQSKLALGEAPVVTKAEPVLSNSFKKNLSFRSLGTFVDYGIAYVVTANTAISTAIALTINATDSVWFIMNDRYWDDYYARQSGRDPERLVDFLYIGPSAGPGANS